MATRSQDSATGLFWKNAMSGNTAARTAGPALPGAAKVGTKRGAKKRQQKRNEMRELQ